MNEELQQKLAELADKLGVSVEHLWGVLVDQAFYSSCWSLASFAVVIGAIFFCYKVGWFCCDQVKEKCKDERAFRNDEQLPWLLGGIVLAVLGVILAIVAIAMFSAFSHTLAGFYNPEYWAMKEIGDLL